MTVIVHISDLHISKSDFNKDAFFDAVREINTLAPDMIILTGDLTQNGFHDEFIEASNYLKEFDPLCLLFQEIGFS